MKDCMKELIKKTFGNLKRLEKVRLCRFLELFEGKTGSIKMVENGGFLGGAIFPIPAKRLGYVRSVYLGNGWRYGARVNVFCTAL